MGNTSSNLNNNTNEKKIVPIYENINDKKEIYADMNYETKMFEDLKKIKELKSKREKEKKQLFSLDNPSEEQIKTFGKKNDAYEKEINILEDKVSKLEKCLNITTTLDGILKNGSIYYNIPRDPVQYARCEPYIKYKLGRKFKIDIDKPDGNNNVGDKRVGNNDVVYKSDYDMFRMEPAYQDGYLYRFTNKPKQ